MPTAVALAQHVLAKEPPVKVRAGQAPRDLAGLSARKGVK